MEAIHFTDVEKSAFRAAYAPAGTTDEQWAAPADRPQPLAWGEIS